jgi:hypothetical protein
LNSNRSMRLHLSQNVLTVSGAHSASCRYKRHGYLFPRIKWAWRESDDAPSSTTEVKNEWSLTSTPLICLHGMGRKSFTCFDLHQTVDSVQEANNLKCDAPSSECCRNSRKFYVIISQHPIISGSLSPC